MKINIIKRMTSLMIMVIMLFVFSGEDIKVISDVVSVTTATQGIGIINTVYPENEGAAVTYQLTFSSGSGGISLSKPIEFTTAKGKKAILQTNGKIELEPKDSVVFSNNAEFNAFIEENADYGLDIEIKPINSITDGRDTYKFYSDPVKYTYKPKTGAWENSDGLTAKVTDFKASIIKPLVEVERSWRDRGVSRDEEAYNDFTIMNGSDPVEVTSAFCTITKENSNKDVYTYCLPEYDANGDKIVYTVNSNLEQFDSDVSHENEPVKPASLPALPDVSDKPGVKLFSASSKGLTSMKFNIEWLDTAKPCTDSKTEERIRAYLKNHFTLFNDSGIDQNLANIADNNIVINTTTWEVEIKGLPDISADNTAIVYELRPKASELPLIDGTSTYVKDKDENNIIDLKNDAYEVKAVNLGVHSSVTDMVYHGGKLSLLLTGKKDYEGNVAWKDADNPAARKNNEKAATVTVWRYIDDSNEHQEEADYDPLEKSAQVASQNINGQTDTSFFKVENVDKYDNKGRAYTYYALEKINVGGNYKEFYVSLSSPEERLPEGNKTVYNKLSAEATYKVDAKWIAAARQGGTGTATFELQRKNAAGGWEIVEKLVINDFRAEQMEIEKEFNSVEVYDDDGYKYTYQIVQTNIGRTDSNIGSDNTNAVEYVAPLTDIQTIQLGDEAHQKDKYNITATMDGTTAKFTYTLVGDVNITMKKQWWDKNNNQVDLQDKTAHFVTKKFNDSTKQYESIGTQGEQDITGSGEKTITVPRYDGLGHEIEYIVNETTHFEGYYSTYSFTRNAVTGDYLYIVNNIPTKDEGNSYISIRKEWVDDGEQEFRKPIFIKAEGDTTSGGAGVWETEQWVELKEGNAWQDRIIIDKKYISTDNGTETVSVPLNLFKEYFVENSTEGYWSIDQITADDRVNAEAKWIYRLLSNRVPDLASDYKNQVQAENFIKFGSISDTSDSSSNWQIIGVYRSANHYYAVECKSESAYMSGTVGGLVFRNTRIGVVSYKIKFNWNTGIQTENIDSVEVKITPKMQFTDDVSGNKVYKYFTIAPDGTITPTEDKSIAYSQPYTLTMSDILAEQTDPVSGQIIKYSGEYYIMNLPKYDTNGVIIKYEMDEVTLKSGDEETTITNGSCTFNNNNMVVEIKTDTTEFGKTVTPDYNSDDLMKIIITNTFVNTTDFLVHKKWFDNTHAYAKRPDLYIRLWRYPEDTPENEISTHAEKVPGRDKDYSWTQHEGDEENFWHYKFTGLDLYDSRGYRYIYFVEELPMEGYKTTYDNNFDQTTAEAGVTPPEEYLDDPEDTNTDHNPRANHALNDYGKRGGADNKTIIYQKAPEAQLSDKTRAYNNGIIVNTIYDEVVVDGDKLWQHISSVADNYKQYFPVAKVYLLRFYTEDGVTYIANKAGEGNIIPAPNENTPINLDETPYVANRVASVQIYNGENTFNFQYGSQYTHNELINQYFVVHNPDGTVCTATSPEGSEDNIVLPKYDENGYLIKYCLAEEAIHGYAFRISKQTIINDYYGGDPIRFTVEKEWSGPELDAFIEDLKNDKITDDRLLPKIKVCLHQMIDIPKTDENGDILYDDKGKPQIEKTIEYNTFTKTLTLSNDILNDNQAVWTCTFGDNNELRTIAPIGQDVPFRYYVTEELSNNDDRSVVELKENEDKGLGYVFKRYDITKDNNDNIQYEPDEDCSSNSPYDTTTATFTRATETVINGTIYKYGQRIKNTYTPDEENFKGEIDVIKTWLNKNSEDENALNAEFNNVKAYTFTVSRETRNIGKQTLFTITTKDNDADDNPVSPEIVIPADSPLAGVSDNTTAEFKYENNIYKINLSLDKKPVIITVDPANKNAVKIKGLAVYARDGVKYTYIVNEEEKAGYTAEGDDSKKITTNRIEKTVPGTNGENITKEVEEPQPLKFDLRNTLDTFDLRINKCFGAKDKDGKIHEIPSSNFEQYFNNEYVKKIKFELWRGIGTYNSETNAWNITGEQLYQKLEDTNPDSEDIIFQLDEANNQYYYVFTHLPKYSPNGEEYTYRLIETTNGGEIQGETTNYVETRYLQKNQTDYGALLTYGTYKTETVQNPDNSTQTIQISSAPAGSGSEALIPANEGEPTSITVQNIFPAKLITIKKVWKDNNNADGMRPDKLPIVIHEDVTDALRINMPEELENDSNHPEKSWNIQVALPDYFYNGGRIGGLKFSLSETLDEMSKKYGYELVSSESDITPAILDGDTELSIPSKTELKLTNKKDRVNGQITLIKAWEDEENKWHTRPAALYFRLYRYSMGSSFSNKETVTKAYRDDLYNDTNQVDLTGLVSGQDYFKVEPNANGNYEWSQQHLPYKRNVTGSETAFGAPTDYQYWIVECDENGIEIENSPTFEFSYNCDNPTSGTPLTLLDDKKTATLSQTITNTLKTIDCEFQKEWNDENNLYNSRADIQLQLQRRITEAGQAADANWKPVNVKSGTPTQENNTDIWTPVYTENTVTSDAAVNAVQSYATNADSQSGIFKNLPLYNEEGKMYEYRVIEKYIGAVEVSKTYNYNNNEYPATSTFNYFVVYDNEQDLDNNKTITTIQNNIIKYKPSQDFIATKTWDDKNNQDGKRPTELTFYLVQREWKVDGNKRTLVDIHKFEKTINQDNNWTCEWKDYPGFSEEGNAYTYAVVEYYDRSQKNEDINDVIGGNVVTKQEGNTITKTVTDGDVVTIYIDNWPDVTHIPIGSVPSDYDMLPSNISAPVRKGDEEGNPILNPKTGEEIFVQTASITNKTIEEREKKNLTVNKEWLNDTGYEAIRPDSIQVELYCHYDTYRYDDSGAIVKGVPVDKKVSEAAEDWKESQLGGYTFPPNYEFIRILTPTGNNKLSADNWKNALSFENLPVNINFCGDGIKNGKSVPIYYYVKEIEPTISVNGGDNPYTYGVDYSDTQKSYKKNPDDSNNSTDTTLTGDAPSVIAANELKTRDIIVTKNWNDNGYTEKPLHYDIDFTLSGSGATDFIYSQTQTLTAYKTENGHQTENTVKTVKFENVPIYDKDGAVINYSVSEKVSSSEKTHQSGYYISRYSATTNKATNYTNNTDLSSYTITPTGSNVINYYTIENELPVIAIKADKLWDDNNNQDGQRPEELNFTLNRKVLTKEATGTASAEYEIDNAFHPVESDKSSSHQNDSIKWNVDFGIQPKFNTDNLEYIYSITEEAKQKEGEELRTLAQREYARYVGTEVIDTNKQDNYIIIAGDNSDGVTNGTKIITFEDNGTVIVDNEQYTMPVYTYHFKNVYKPKTAKLKVEKSWAGDENFNSWTRPDDVTLTLCYQYNNEPVKALSDVQDTDPVRKLFASGTDFQVKLSGDKSATLWTSENNYDFEGLPLYVNIGGTAVYNGNSYPITYSLKESLNGYSISGSTAAPLTEDTNNYVNTLAVTNTLLTKAVQVRKQWVDNGYSGDQAEHYNVNLTLSNTNGSTGTGTINSLTDTIPVTEEGKIISFTVPQYFANNTAAQFELTENTSDQKYGYVTSYSSNITDISNSFDASTVDNNLLITVTNTLPLTEVSVTKAWDDSSNTYQLRPDSISLQLWRRAITNNGTEWTTENPGWVQCNAAFTTTKNADNTWRCTFTGLPKFDEHNIQYEYKVSESKVNAYDTYYQNASNNDVTDYNTVVKQDSASAENSTMSFNIKNTLIREDVTFIKSWNDNGYTTNLHYPVTYSVQKPADTEMALNTSVTLGEINDTSTVKTNGDMQWSKIVSLPVYDKSGKPIKYTVSETNTNKYGYTPSATVSTQNGAAHSGYASRYYDTYTITNELPLTSVKAVKVWAGNLEMYPNISAVVNVSLTRSSDNTADTTFNDDTTANTKQIGYNGTDNENDYVTFEKLLVKDQNNKTYSYTITEQTVQGYTTAYTNQTAEAVKDTEQVVTITNTPILYNAEFVKYDVTDYNRNKDETGFSLVTLANAAFELHRVLNNQGSVVSVKENTDGSYSPDASGTAIITTGNNGIIKLTNLQPNEYYLVETPATAEDPNGGAPAGYQRSDKKFRFTIAVSQQNSPSVTYGEHVDTLNKGLGKDMPDHGIPNEQTGSHLKLTKKDEKEKTPIADAYYYLLRLYDYEYRKDTTVSYNTGTVEEKKAAYVKNAIEALKTNYNKAVGLYWEKVGEEYYRTNANGVLQAEGNAHGIYVFYEVKAPAGYEINKAYSNTVTDNNNVLGPVEFHTGYTSEEHNLTHYEPRKDVQIKILKTDDFGNPLKDAEFDLYQGNERLATVKTGDNGMNDAVTILDEQKGIKLLEDNKTIEIDTSQYNWDTEFYFLETTAPNGYSNLEDSQPKKITFRLTPEIAEETLHIVRANDTRLKGNVTLTKIASEATSTIAAGAPLKDAEFKLYKKVGNAAACINDTALTTDEAGKIHVENLEWGDYYFEETKAPNGFRLSDNTEDRRVYFTVGRSNCGETAQELTMENEPEKASLNIIKHIDDYDEAAWGKPSFIFKITQTKLADGTIPTNPVTLTKIITPTESVTDGFEGQTHEFDIEPGTYTIKEMQSARYTAEKASEFTDNSSSITEKSNAEYTATFTISLDGKAEVKFFNKLTYYDKFSHADSVVNTFNGYKAIQVNDESGLELTDSTSTTDIDHKYTVTIEKNELTPILIRSDGTTEPITDYENLTISIDESEITVEEVKKTAEKDSIKITGRKEDVSGSVYKLKAVYGGVAPSLTTYFELRFKDTLQFSKTEKTVIFRSDKDNKSYYLDGTTHTLVYTLDFMIETIDNGSTQTHIIKSILHDGTSTGKTNQDAFPEAKIDPAFSAEAAFDKWEYSYKTTKDEVSAQDLLTAILNAPDNTEITVRPVLKAKTATPTP